LLGPSAEAHDRVVEPTRSPYAVPLAELDAFRVRPEQWVCVAPDPAAPPAGPLVAGPLDGLGVSDDGGGGDG
jgi:hypothetical protein